MRQPRSLAEGPANMKLGLVFLVGTALAAPARAADIQSARSLDLEVRGTIAQRCSMGSIGNMHFGDLSRTGLGATTRVQLECNVPFTMGIRAQNGGLTHTHMPRGQGPYAGTLPYSIGIEMPVRRPQSAMVGKTFESRQLIGGGSISTNGGIATEGMLLAVNLGTASGEAGLLAGSYGETITITVTPSL